MNVSSTISRLDISGITTKLNVSGSIVESGSKISADALRNADWTPIINEDGSEILTQ